MAGTGAGIGAGPGWAAAMVCKADAGPPPRPARDLQPAEGAQCGRRPWGEMKYFAGDANRKLLTRDV